MQGQHERHVRRLGPGRLLAGPGPTGDGGADATPTKAPTTTRLLMLRPPRAP
jgi:hypothetical protein